MPSTSTGKSPSPHDAPSTRAPSLFSRIKAPFATKTRHIDEFFVQPDDPHKQYGPGDVITGSIILKILKPLRVTHITVCLHGFVQVYRAPNNPGDGYRAYTGTAVPGKTMRTGYFGNGFASLFVDEVTLCGEGRLGEGTYQFGFELVFPKGQQPSSIDFERGTIKYMITCTLTKPTTITPTVVCDREVKFGEDINIASLSQPKPRIIMLEPLNKSRRSKHRSLKRVATATTTTEGERRNSCSTTRSNGTPTQRGSATTESQAEGDTPMSPAPSEVSFDDSCLSSCGTSSAMESATQSALSNGSTNGPSSANHRSSQRIISTNIQISRAGFLRGDTINFRITIQHRKLVRSLHGIIVTFYRQARVDMHPALPIVGKNGKEEKSDDYYPKSKTGLGGLSLSAAGSTHVFRKDLSQSFTSLIVNPDTLSADIKAAVRVPEEAFPSISSVPGSMISFKYYVEVILDIQGKLTGLDKYFQSAGTLYGPGAGANIADGANSGMMSAWGGHFIDTQDIRREKSIISSLFEVVIGTRDSERVQNQLTRVVQPPASDVTDQTPTRAAGTPVQQSQPYPEEDLLPYDYEQAQYEEQWHSNGYMYDNGYGNEYSNHGHEDLYRPGFGTTPMQSVPLPDLREEEPLSEKEQLRRAEARLLPSQPPDADEPESSRAVVAFAPSAPSLDGQHHPNDQTRDGSRAVTSNPDQSIDQAGSSSPAPAYSGPGRPFLSPIDDKQELQRRRLEEERSAPEEHPSDNEAAGPSAPDESNRHEDDDLTPSAPVLEDDGDSHNVGSSFSPLPKYER